MKKFYWVLGLMAIMCMISAVALEAAVLYVPGGYPTIQAAINAAASGDTIIVAPAVYKEMVTINKSIILLGAKAGIDPRNGARTEGVGESIIDGENTRDYGIYAYNSLAFPFSGVTIDGFELRNAKKANIWMEGQWFFEPKFEHLSNLQMLNLLVHDTQNGMGINIRNCSYVTLQYIVSHDNKGIATDSHGVYFDGGKNYSIENSWFYNNDGNGISLNYNFGTAVKNCKANNNMSALNQWVWGHAGGLIAYNSYSTTIENSEFNDNNGCGIHMYKENKGQPSTGTYSTLKNNKAFRNKKVWVPTKNAYFWGDGVRIYSSNNVTISGAEIYGSDRHGIYVGSRGMWDDLGEPIKYHALVGNYIHNNGEAGIRFEGPNANVAVDCKATFNNITDNIGNGISNTTPNTVLATNNWWGNAGGPGVGVANGVTGLVNYDPWLTVPISGAVAQTVPPGTTTVGSSTLGVSADVTTTAGTTVTVATYASNPGGTTPFNAAGKFVDINLSSSVGVSEVFVKVYYTDAEISSGGLVESLLKLYWWDGSSSSWISCSDTGVDTTANYIWARITASSTPNLSQLVGTVFGGGTPPTVAASISGGHGGVSPASQTVNFGESASVTITPDVGYHIASITDNRSPVSIANPYVISNVTADHTVVVTFAIDTYTLTYTPGPNGSITGTTPQTVNHGASGTAVTAVPETNYHFEGWSDGVTTKTRLDANVTANISVTANFAATSYTFIIEEAKIDFKKKPADDKIHVKGTFVLGSGSDGIKEGESVTVVIGQFKPPAFNMDVKDNGKKWEFKREKGATGIKNMVIELKKNNELKFDIHVDDADLGDISTWTLGANPAYILISLQIGDDKGTAPAVQMKVHKDKLELDRK